MSSNSISREEYMVLSLSTQASEGLRTLLETKHLYQNVNFDPTPLAQKLYAGMGEAGNKNAKELETFVLRKLSHERLLLAERQLHTTIGQITTPAPTLVLYNIGLHCKRCDRREAFAPVWYTDAAEEIRKVFVAAKKNIPMRQTFQQFFLAYQCQRCVGVPEGFLVRREGWVLSLHGRSPIETLELPIQIPKAELNFYRDAVIAYNTGKILAALFYLRTFIEQFGRRVTGKSGKVTGDEIFDAYADTLPFVLRPQMPSLREWYDKLSEAIHSAKEDTGLFETAKLEIEKHFDIRRVFNIPDTAAPAAATAVSTTEDKSDLPGSSPTQAESD